MNSNEINELVKDIVVTPNKNNGMEKIGKIDIDANDNILIDIVSADKMEDVNVDSDVVEMMDKIAA